MSKKIHAEQTRIKKIIIGIIGILFLFYLVSCNSTEDTSPEDVLPLPKATPPSAVGNLKVDSFTNNQVVLSWTAPTNTGTTDGTTLATLSGYVVKYKQTGANNFIKIDEKSVGVRLTGTLTSTTATVIGLSGNTSYTFLVVAFNSANAVGLDADAPTVEQTTAVAPPGNFRLAQCAKTTSVELTWDASSGATSYKVYRDGAEIINVPTNSYTDEDLTPENTYTYKVQSCTTAGCSADSDPLTITTINDQVKNLRNLIDSGRIPTDLTGYDKMSREIFSNYSSGVPLVAKYLKPGGSGDGSSFVSMSGNLKDVLDGITDAAADKVYAVFLAGGNYTNGDSVSMKNHVAIIGGVGECLEPSDMVTALDGENSYQVFSNNNGLNDTALLYGVTITDGFGKYGGGMYNFQSSPSLVEVAFSGNSADEGGGMYNIDNSSPSLVGVTFSGNKTYNGGGMYNYQSSPSLVRVTFSGNTVITDGGGMYNYQSSPSLVGVTFSGNTAVFAGGGMYNENSSPSLVGVTFSGNTVDVAGGGMYNGWSSPSLVGVTFSGNTATDDAGAGGGMYNYQSSPSLIGVTFSGNTAVFAGGGMYIDNDGEAGPLIIDGIFWSNTAPQFSFRTDSTDQENLRIYNSIVEGGTGTLKSGTTNTNVNQGGFGSGLESWNAAPVAIFFSNIIDKDPGLLPLANNGGSVLTHAIPNDSPAVNQGLYVKRKGSTFYYSKDNTTWYTQPDLSGTSVTPPTDAEDVTATDATGSTRTGRPDLGAYEAR